MKPPPLAAHQTAGDSIKPKFEMETLVGYLLTIGVILSMALIVAGLIWQWLSLHNLQLNYTLSGVNLLGFAVSDFHQLVAGAIGPRLLLNSGIIVLLLTPYFRVLASMVYFAAVERNLKYTLFTGFVLTVLTYSLFLH